MADNCTGVFRPCSYPSCSQKCIVTRSPDLYACNDGTGAPDGYDRPCSCGCSSEKYTSALVAAFFKNQDGCVSTACSPSDQDVFWTTWVNLCLVDGFDVPRGLIPHQNTLGAITVTGISGSVCPSLRSSSKTVTTIASASNSTTFKTTLNSQMTATTGSNGIIGTASSSGLISEVTSPPAASKTTFSTAEIIGTVFGVVGSIPTLSALIAWLFTFRRSEDTGRRELRWRHGSRELLFTRRRRERRGATRNNALILLLQVAAK